MREKVTREHQGWAYTNRKNKRNPVEKIHFFQRMKKYKKRFRSLCYVKYIPSPNIELIKSFDPILTEGNNDNLCKTCMKRIQRVET